MCDAAACICASEKVAPHGSAPRPQVGPERASQRQVGPERASQRDHNYLRHIRQNQTGCPPERAASPHATGVGSKCCRPPLETPTPDHSRHTRPVGPTYWAQPPTATTTPGDNPGFTADRRPRAAGRPLLTHVAPAALHNVLPGTWSVVGVSKDPRLARDPCFGMGMAHVGS